MRAYAAMQPGAFMAILVGEIRANGRYYSMFQNLALPGEFYQTYIKLQHNTWSDRKGAYNSSQRSLTGHEMIAVIKKPSGYEIAYVIPKEYVMDIRDSKTATWKDVVISVMRKLGGQATLEAIYTEIEGRKKCTTNPHWKAKVRQTLQMCCTSIKRGEWAIAA